MLDLVDLKAGYNRTDVLRSVSITVPQGAFVGLLGPNGAGKTTLMRSISGFTRVHSGEIRFEGRSLCGMSPEAIVDLGIIHVPQGRMLFPELTIEENLQLGAYRNAARGAYQQNLRHVESYFPILRERANQLAGVLSGGEQQMLAIGRALMAQPRLLILDEPSLGLAPRIIDEIFQVMKRINEDDGVTILVAEQNAMKVLQSVGRAYVLESGVIAHEGKASDLIRNEQIKSSYLGVA
jgi:branched-chain amino acid transport system ATP-binding protein